MDEERPIHRSRHSKEMQPSFKAKVLNSVFPCLYQDIGGTSNDKIKELFTRKPYDSDMAEILKAADAVYNEADKALNKTTANRVLAIKDLSGRTVTEENFQDLLFLCFLLQASIPMLKKLFEDQRSKKEEAVQQAKRADEKARIAEDRLKKAEQRARNAEYKINNPENRVKEAEDLKKEAESKANKAQEIAMKAQRTFQAREQELNQWRNHVDRLDKEIGIYRQKEEQLKKAADIKLQILQKRLDLEIKKNEDSTEQLNTLADVDTFNIGLFGPYRTAQRREEKAIRRDRRFQEPYRLPLATERVTKFSRSPLEMPMPHLMTGVLLTTLPR